MRLMSRVLKRNGITGTMSEVLHEANNLAYIMATHNKNYTREQYEAAVWLRAFVEAIKEDIRMKKGQYNILVKYEDGMSVERVDGYILPDPESGLTFGARYRNRVWEITELSTGLLVTSHADPHLVTHREDILPYIDRMRSTVLNLLKTHPESVDRFERVRKAVGL